MSTSKGLWYGSRIDVQYVKTIVGIARQKYAIPSIAVTIMNSDALLFKEIQGTRIAGTENPATFNDFFHIASCSKSVLAMIAGRLVESGKISWNVKFMDIFPDLMEQANKEYYQITLEDLFPCEAGIQPYTSGQEEFPKIDPLAQNRRLEFIKYLLKQPPASERKSSSGVFKHLYSNASYTMAAVMLERTCRKTYETLAKETLSDDVGYSVHIGWPNNISADQPWGHMIVGKEVKSYPPDHEYRLCHLLTPAGDLSMKPLDYGKYTQLHLQGLRGKSNYLSSATYQHIHFSHQSFSLGVANGDKGGHKFSGFDGSAGTFFCRSLIIPESDFAFTIMMNAGSGTSSMNAVNWLTMRIVKKRFGWWWKFWL